MASVVPSYSLAQRNSVHAVMPVDPNGVVFFESRRMEARCFTRVNWSGLNSAQTALSRRPWRGIGTIELRSAFFDLPDSAPAAFEALASCTERSTGRIAGMKQLARSDKSAPSQASVCGMNVSATSTFLALFGWLLSPIIAAAAMAASSVSAILNALRLRSARI